MEEVDDTQNQSTESTEEGQKDAEKEHEPAEGSKRWKEVYHEAKEAGRKVAEVEQKLVQRDQDFELLRTQNDTLQNAIDSVADKVTKGDRPDPTEDPEGYDNYIMERMQRKQKPVPRQPITATPPVNTRQQAMEDAMAAAKDDYYQIIAAVKPDMDRDVILRNQIWGSPNPYQAAYKYGADKAKRAKQSIDDTTEQGYVEGETIHTDTQKKALNADEKKICADLGIKEENYLKQREFINSQKG